MMEYIKSWQCWLLAVFILLIVNFPVTSWGKEFKLPEHEKTNKVKKWSLPDLKWGIHNFHIHYKYTKLEAEYERMYFVVGVNKKFKPKAQLTFTILEW